MMTYCEQCRKEVKYTVNDIEKKSVIKEKEYMYIGKEAVCSTCEHVVFVDEIHDYNLEQLERAFRMEEKIITVDEIQQIIDKYSVKKRPLSLLLGWGELTLTRFLDGNIPSKQYSEQLKRILQDSQAFEKILDENKDTIPVTTYQKAKEKLHAAKEIYINKEDRIEQIIHYILMKSKDITPLALQKLLYYAQAFHIAFNDKNLFENDCEAWIHGPVYREIYDKYKHYGYNLIEEYPFKIDTVMMNEMEREIVDSIITNFGCYSGKILENMTHVETPWNITRGDLKGEESCDRVIEKELISTYFIGVLEKYKMLNVADIKDYSNDLFLKVNH